MCQGMFVFPSGSFNVWEERMMLRIYRDGHKRVDGVALKYNCSSTSALERPSLFLAPIPAEEKKRFSVNQSLCVCAY